MMTVKEIEISIKQSTINFPSNSLMCLEKDSSLELQMRMQPADTLSLTLSREHKLSCARLLTHGDSKITALFQIKFP